MEKKEEKLVFDWNVKKNIVKEVYPSSLYDPENGEYAVSDYLFEGYSTISFYSGLQFLKSFSEYEENTRRLLDSISECCRIFLQEITLLKNNYNRLKKFNHYYFMDVRGLAKGNRGEQGVIILEEMKADILRVCPFSTNNNHYLQLFCEKIEQLMVDFNNNIDLVVSAFVEVMDTLQNRANQLVELAKNIWNENIFKKASKIASSIRKGIETDFAIHFYLQEKEDEFNKLKKILSSNENAKEMFIEGKKCFAICISKRKTYFALSGIDYDFHRGKINNLPIVNNDVISVGCTIKKIYPKWIYAQLLDNTRSYTYDFSVMSYCGSYREFYTDVMSNSSNLKLSYSCCERKIFSHIPLTNKKYEFFIKYLPCKKCLPAMGMKNKRIISYVPFDKKGFGENILYTTVLVHELKHLDQYKVEESYIVV